MTMMARGYCTGRLAPFQPIGEIVGDRAGGAAAAVTATGAG
jgi:hypothetical protein